MHPANTSAWLSAILMVIVSPSAISAEWTMDPAITLRSGYNDNIRLTSAPHDSVWETDITPSARFGFATENKGVFGKASTSIRRFTGGSGLESSSALDREDYHLDIQSHYRTELDRFELGLITIRDSTLDSELDETGQVISNRATRTKYSVLPSWSRRLDELTRLELGYAFTKVDYSDEPPGSNLVEYDYEVISASLSRQFTPKVQASLATAYSKYKPDSGAESDTITAQIGISRSFSETFSTSWLAGIRQTTTDRPVPTGICLFPPAGSNSTFPGCTGGGIPIQTGVTNEEQKNNGSVFSISVTKLLETGLLGLDLSRASNPGGTGELLDTTRLQLTGEYGISERLDSSMTVELSNIETIANSSGNPDQTDRDLLRIVPRLSWKWQRDLYLSAHYEYTKNENNFTSGGGSATRNAFYLTLRYQPVGFSISR